MLSDTRDPSPSRREYRLVGRVGADFLHLAHMENPTRRFAVSEARDRRLMHYDDIPRDRGRPLHGYFDVYDWIPGGRPEAPPRITRREAFEAYWREHRAPPVEIIGQCDLLPDRSEAPGSHRLLGEPVDPVHLRAYPPPDGEVLGAATDLAAELARCAQYRFDTLWMPADRTVRRGIPTLWRLA
jgi:hypothetical protein